MATLQFFTMTLNAIHSGATAIAINAIQVHLLNENIAEFVLCTAVTRFCCRLRM